MPRVLPFSDESNSENGRQAEITRSSHIEKLQILRVRTNFIQERRLSYNSRALNLVLQICNMGRYWVQSKSLSSLSVAAIPLSGRRLRDYKKLFVNKMIARPLTSPDSQCGSVAVRNHTLQLRLPFGHDQSLLGETTSTGINPSILWKQFQNIEGF